MIWRITCHNQLIVLVSSIVPRKVYLNKKGKEVNTILEKRCNEINLAFISQVTLGCSHRSYAGLYLNDKGATLFTENNISALSRVACPRNVRKNSFLKSFFDSDYTRAKWNASTSTKSIKVKHPKNLFFGYLNINSICNKFASIHQKSI